MYTFGRTAFLPVGAEGGRIAIVVAGMHRSGTSLLAHLLTHLGARLPDDRIEAGAGNPLGHWEPRQLVRLNESILAALRRGPLDPAPLPPGWQDSPRAERFVERIAQRIERDYEDAPLLLIKDPRVCRLLPLYAAALERIDVELRAVLAVRHPAEVMRSLAARDGMRPSVAALLWLRYVLEAEWHTRGCRRGWADFAATVADCERTIGALGRSLGFPWLVALESVGSDLRGTVRPTARHWQAARLDFAWREYPLVGRVWEAVCRACAGDPAAAAMFDECRALLAEFDRYHAECQMQLAAMQSSWSWRLTAPLRLVRRVKRPPSAGAAPAPAT